MLGEGLSDSRVFHPRQPWTIILGFVLVTFLLYLAVGKLLNVVFPAGALAIGIYLYFKYPLMYCSFAWWLWFMTPFVRRLADFKGGYTEPSPILLAPFLASSITIVTLYRKLPRQYTDTGFLFLVALTGIFYGFCVGMVQGEAVSVVVGLLDVAVPVLFAHHLYANWRDYPAYKSCIQRTFIWGGLVTGLYGVHQYLTAPAWDRAWLLNFKGEIILTHGSPFGIPVPFGIRVWSTMNSPLDYSVVTMACLIIILGYDSIIKLPAAGAGLLTFLLAQARTAWGGLFIGVVAMIISLKQKYQIKLVVLLFIFIVFAIPLLSVEPFNTVVAERLETLSNLESDGSGDARLGTYGELLIPALTSFVGYGVGSVPNFGHILDSSILWILFSLGLFGGLFYFGSWGILLVQTFRASELKSDPFAGACRAIALSAIPMMLLGPIVYGISGMIVWGFLGASVAACKYYRYRT